jgi:hypothetical protein
MARRSKMDPNRERLANYMAARRVELRRPWREIAAAAGMSEQNLLRIRQGDITVTEQAARGIDTALNWEPGSVLAILDDGEPTPKDAVTPRTPRGNQGIPRVALMSPEELAEITVDLMEVSGPDEAKRFLSNAVKLREQWADRLRTDTDIGSDTPQGEAS